MGHTGLARLCLVHWYYRTRSPPLQNSLEFKWWEYVTKQGKIELSFDPKLKPYLLKLKDNFTTYKLENVIRLKSFYSIRIYELLKQYEKLKERTFSITQLREYLCINNEQYPLYANFKQKVLNIAKNELKDKSDIYFDFEEIKQSRKIEKIKFIIRKNKVEPLINSIEINDINQLQISLEQENAIKELKVFIKDSISDDELLSILEAANGDIALIKNRYSLAKSKKELDNLVGFIIWACKEPEYKFKTTVSKGKSKFNNFEGRKWDYEDIERREQELLKRVYLNKN